jgi:DNA-binding NtrC family response regulator
VAEKYHMPPIVLTDEAKRMMMDYPWYGNVRELKNITEQIAVVETERTITPAILQNYLSFVPTGERMPAVVADAGQPGSQITDRELLLKALTMGQMINEMRKEISELRAAVAQLAQGGVPLQVDQHQSSYLPAAAPHVDSSEEEEFLTPEIIEDEAVSLEERERRAILHALDRAGGNRKQAAAELHISERTLYRKLKEYDIA